MRNRLNLLKKSSPSSALIKTIAGNAAGIATGITIGNLFTNKIFGETSRSDTKTHYLNHPNPQHHYKIQHSNIKDSPT